MQCFLNGSHLFIYCINLLFHFFRHVFSNPCTEIIHLLSYFTNIFDRFHDLGRFIPDSDQMIELLFILS